ncbi:MAG: cytochrome c biogenesis protein ResB [Elusimicrobiales bacterium]
MINALSSLRLFYAVCLALAAAFVYQTVFNRGAPVYASPWFAALGVLLAFNIAACSARRARTASLHYILIHAGLVLVILGAFASRAFRFEAQLPLRTGTATDLAQSSDAVYKLPFSVRLEAFRLDYYSEPRGVLTVSYDGKREEFDAAAGAEINLPAHRAKLKVLRLVRDFGLAGGNSVIDKSPYWHNPAAQLEVAHGGKTRRLWFFVNFPGMHGGELPFRVAYGLKNAEVKNFTSALLVKPAEGAAFTAEVSVNSPLRTGGYTLYQSSYDPADAGYTLLTVTRDRGTWIVYLGFAALLGGILLWLKK